MAGRHPAPWQPPILGLKIKNLKAMGDVTDADLYVRQHSIAAEKQFSALFPLWPLKSDHRDEPGSEHRTHQRWTTDQVLQTRVCLMQREAALL